MNRRSFVHYMAAASVTSLIPGVNMHAAQAVKEVNTPHQAGNELDHHTLDHITFTRIKLRYPRLVGRNSGKGIHGYGPDITVCTLYTKQGAKGIGQLRGSQERAEMAFNSLKGKKLTEVFNPDIGALNEDAIVFDIPLHDLAGVILSQPVYKMLGREKPFVTKCYSGMIYMDDIDPLDNPSGLDKIFEECQYDYNKGYRQLKLKIGRGSQWMPLEAGIKRDIEVTRLVHNYFPDVDILIDANDGYTYQDFIRYMEGIEDVPIWWIEEPFRETIKDFTKLREWLGNNRRRNTLLADGEAHPDLPLALEMGQKGILDVYLDDIMGYGFTNWRALMPVLKENKLLASPHNWGDYMKTIYTMHLAGGLGNTCTIEGVTCYSNDIDFGLAKLENGILIPADSPGFGMTLLKD